MTRVGSIIVCSALLVLTSCATRGPSVRSNTSPGVDLSSFATYGFMDPLSTDRDNGARTPLGMSLIAGMDTAMARRGLTRSDSPDILVNFYVNTERRTNVRHVPSSTFHSYRGRRYGTWVSYQPVVQQYTVGTLSIDLIDPTQRMLVWEGVAEGRLRGDTSDFSQEQIDDIVDQVMQHFVPRPD